MTPQTQKLRPAEGSAAYQNLPNNFIKKFPAFGRQLDDLRKKGQIPALLPIMSLYNWNIAKSFARIVVDRSIKPSSYAFDFLAGLPVQICVEDSDLHLIDDLVAEIAKSRPSEITLFRFGPAGTSIPACSVLYRSQFLEDVAA